MYPFKPYMAESSDESSAVLQGFTSSCQSLSDAVLSHQCVVHTNVHTTLPACINIASMAWVHNPIKCHVVLIELV